MQDKIFLVGQENVNKDSYFSKHFLLIILVFLYATPAKRQKQSKVVYSIKKACSVPRRH